jgi:ketosteroid isomerase-like protein
MKTVWLVSALTWVVTLSVTGNAAPTNSADAQLRTQLEAMDQQFEQFLARNDIPSSLNRYSDNPIVMSPDGQRYVGRQQLEQYFKGSLLPDVHNEVHIKLSEVHRSGHLAYEIGSYTWKVHREMFTAKPAGAK